MAPKGPETIYFGGGTPSLVPSTFLATLIDTIRTPQTTEITLEVNPGDVSPQSLSNLKSIGITRLSLGIQSFNRKHLRRLGRRKHTKGLHATTRLGCTNTLILGHWISCLVSLIKH